ncbi:MAG TPA: hypothetical protein VF270_03285, partial [Ignavibacteriaceae bacterium]
MKIVLVTISFLICFALNQPANLIIVNGEGSFHNDSSAKITISVVGDLMCHSPQFEYAKVGADSFDFDP